MRYILSIFFIFLSILLFSQQERVVRAYIENGDTIPIINLDVLEVKALRTWKSRVEYNRYKKLKAKVVKVYPLARLAAKKLIQYSDQLSQVKSKRKKKKFYKVIEQEMRDEYEGVLRSLTVSEGRILIKLLDRETGNTSYALVKDIRGKFSAYFWQGMARIFGHNLKSKYDAMGEDIEIEFIVQRIEQGLIPIK